MQMINCSWTTSSPRRSYSIVKEGDEIVSVRVFPQSSDESVVTICRQYGVHKGTPQFWRIISTVRDSKGELIPKAILHYFFAGGKKVIFLFTVILHEPSDHITEHNRVHLMS